MAIKQRRFVFLMEDEDLEIIHRYTVVASSFVEAWETLSTDARVDLTLYGMFSFKLEDSHAVG
jgi:hypothetical protein